MSADGRGQVGHVGGVHLRLLAERTGLTAALSGALARRGFHPLHDRGQVLVDLAVAITLGAVCIRDVRLLEHQRPVFGPTASFPTVWRALRETDGLALRRIERARATVRRHVYALLRDRPEGFPEVEIDGVPLRGWTVIDSDGTLINAPSDKQGARGTYKGTFGHHVFVATCDNTGEQLAAVLHEGGVSANDAAVNIDILTRAVTQLPWWRRQKILFRVDGAGSRKGRWCGVGRAGPGRQASAEPWGEALRCAAPGRECGRTRMCSDLRRKVWRGETHRPCGAEPTGCGGELTGPCGVRCAAVRSRLSVRCAGCGMRDAGCAWCGAHRMRVDLRWREFGGAKLTARAGRNSPGPARPVLRPGRGPTRRGRSIRPGTADQLSAFGTFCTVLRMVHVTAKVTAGRSGIGRAGADRRSCGNREPAGAAPGHRPVRPAASDRGRTRGLGRLASGVQTLVVVLAWTLTWMVAGPSGAARAASPCAASLCVLNASAADALYVHPGSIHVTGDILVNSTNSQAALVSGATTVTAAGGTIGGPAAPAGFATSGGGSYSPAPTNQAAGTDPYAALAQCPAASACPTTPAAPYPAVNHISGNQTISPGVYTSITNLNGTLTLNPGTYVVTTGITISGGKLNGTGVTIYLACPTYPTACGPLTLGAAFTDQSGGKTTLSAPTTGAFAGFSIIADRNNTAGVSVSGNGTWITGGGTVYTAAGKLSASSGGKASFTRAVVDSIETSGSNSSQISVIPNTGTMSISLPTAASLGAAAPGGTISAALGQVTVSDGRGLATSTWTATVAATNFTTGAGTPAQTITTANVSYWSGPATSTNGTVTVTPGQSDASAKQALNSSRSAFSSTGNGNSTTSWTPALVVTIPAGAAAGTYTGTITHSVA
ncbi:hypothetical protein C2142_38125 [Streptomyces sp. CB01881]|nr:hypothetical protein C2142_38125 [Streptomyces sp. CB01881]